MPYTYDSFVADFPIFEGIPQAAVERQLRYSVLMLSKPVWGKWYDMAQGLWTAHYLALEYDVTEAARALGMRSPYDVGNASSMSASTGSVAITNTTNALLTSDDPVASDFARTNFGIEYYHLLCVVIPAGAVVYSQDTSESMRR